MNTRERLAKQTLDKDLQEALEEEPAWDSILLQMQLVRTVERMRDDIREMNCLMKDLVQWHVSFDHKTGGR